MARPEIPAPIAAPAISVCRVIDRTLAAELRANYHRHSDFVGTSPRV
jgi:hypothetical protein